jgi:NodT family efflux transporter outer membrane factor (OMF) lipoprotein
MKTLTVGWVLLAACTVGPNYQRPDTPVPHSFSEGAAQGAPPRQGWWTEFHDPVLEALVQRAVAGNLDLQIATARIREERAARGIAEAQALPQVAASGGAGRTKANLLLGQPGIPSAQGVFEAGFDASWEIDIFGGVRRDEEAALAQVQAAEEAREDVLVTLVADIARNYMELRGAQRQIAIVDQQLATLKDGLDLAQSRLDAGMGDETDVAREKGLLADTAARRPALEVVVRRSALRIGVLLGRPPEEVLAGLVAPGALPSAPPDVPQVLPSELLARRPDLRRSEREVAAATARIGVATADLYPRFNIVGSFGRRSDDLGSFNAPSQFWSVGAVFRWPIFQGGRIVANIHVQEARQQQALLNYRKAILIALEEVEDALSEHSRELTREESLRQSVAASDRALALATERYTSGLDSFLGVIDAQRALYSAEDQLVQSERNVSVALIAVYKALGGGWS